MLSSRDTPMNEDGWSLIIEDLRRLALLVGGGSNDLNAGAIDADQQAINDLSTALNSHEVDPAAHAELLANYQLRSDAFTPTYLDIPYGSSPQSTVVNGAIVSITTAFGTPIGTLSSSFSAGVFTAPGNGIYEFSYNLRLTFVTNAAATMNASFNVAAGAYNLEHRVDESNAAAATRLFTGVVSGQVYMTAGNTISVTSTQASTGGTFTSGTTEVMFASIVRLTNS